MEDEIEYLTDIIAAMVRERETINHQIMAATKRLAELREGGKGQNHEAC